MKFLIYFLYLNVEIIMINMKEIIVYILVFLMFNSMIYSTKVIFNYGTDKGGEPMGNMLSIIYLIVVIVTFLIWIL